MDKSSALKTGAIVLLLGGLVGWRVLSEGGNNTAPQPEPTPVAEPTSTAQATTGGAAQSGSGKLEIVDIKKGTGAAAKAGQSVTVHYRGTLPNGKQFDASYDRGEPFTFPLGGGQVIKGWDQGVAGMQVGGKRKLTIPPELGYGAQGAGADIPPNSTLIFEVELLKIG
jgi:peptidylprolyl isomerase